MLGRAVDPEIGGAAAGAGELRPDPGVIGHQGPVGQAGPVAADRVVEQGAPGGIDPVIEAVDPFHVRPEAHASGEIQGEVDAKPAIDRGRVDQVPEGRPAGAAEIVAAGEHEGRHPLGRIARGGAGERLRPEACGIHHRIAGKFAGRRPAEARDPAPLRPRQGLHRRVEGEHPAAILDVAEQRQHQAVAVHDPRPRREQSGGTGEVRLERPRLGPVQQDEALHAVRLALVADRGDLARLRRVRRHDQLTAGAVRDPVALAEVVEHPPPGHAVARPQRAGGIVHAGVDHLGIARRDAGAEGVGRLGDHDLVPAQGERPPDRETDHARADDENIHREAALAVRDGPSPARALLWKPLVRARGVAHFQG